MAKTHKQMIKNLERLKNQLAKTRDELRDLEDEVEALRSISDDAVDNLGYVIDVLSEQV